MNITAEAKKAESEAYKQLELGQFQCASSFFTIAAGLWYQVGDMAAYDRCMSAAGTADNISEKQLID
jgi:hypothetical protein